MQKWGILNDKYNNLSVEYSSKDMCAESQYMNNASESIP